METLQQVIDETPERELRDALNLMLESGRTAANNRRMMWVRGELPNLDNIREEQIEYWNEVEGTIIGIISAIFEDAGLYPE